MESKPFKSVEEQITILKSRGLIIEDDEIKNDFIDRFSELINKYSFVKIEHYGFNKEWKEILNNE